jgi:alkylation response protein AidB-like acyl-CoA dehydrogenase
VLGAVAKGEPSTALILFMTYAFHAAPKRAAAGTARSMNASRARRWPAGLVGTFRVEPELGTPVRGGLPATTARRARMAGALGREDLFHRFDRARLVRRLGQDRRDPVRLGLFLVRPDAEGITIVPEWDHLGMRATVSHKVSLPKRRCRPRSLSTCARPRIGRRARATKRAAVERAGHCHDL